MMRILSRVDFLGGGMERSMRDCIGVFFFMEEVEPGGIFV